MTLYLIRHGQTEANAQKRYCGRVDLPLSREGVAGLLALKARGAYPPATAFCTSGMLRARQTLRLLYGHVDASSLEELAEYDFGDFEMGRHEELLQNPAYLAWIQDTSGHVACPGGESRAQFEQRVWGGFPRLLRWLEAGQPPSAVAILHGGVIVCLMSRLFPEERDFYGWQPPPGLGYRLSRSREGTFIYHTIEGVDSP